MEDAVIKKESNSIVKFAWFGAPPTSLGCHSPRTQLASQPTWQAAREEEGRRHVAGDLPEPSMKQ